MKHNFCTLFDSNYLSRALAMYESLQICSADFHLYVLAFDNKSLEILNKLSLEKITTISLAEFEDAELLKIKPTRSNTEYCWTCTPSIILFAIQKYNLDMCTYIDADLYFYSDPKILLEEIGNSSVLITEHRYTPAYDRTAESGKYCVQFMTFKNDVRGIKVLQWWREACLEWCYARVENGKFGDQKYLDEWTTKFEGIHELQHIGGGVAPWNVQQYNLFKSEENLFIKEKVTDHIEELIFFHFHNMKFYKNNFIQLTSSYFLSTTTKKQLYEPYIHHLFSIKDRIQSFDSSFDPNGAISDIEYKPFTLRDKFWILRDEFKRATKDITFVEIIKRSNQRAKSYNLFSIIDGIYN